MKLEFITHYCQEDSTYMVIVKSNVSHRRSKWTKFMHLLQGRELEIVKGKRYQTPIHALKGGPHEDEIHRNIFMFNDRPQSPAAHSKTNSPTKKDTCKKSKNDSACVIGKLLEKEVIPGKVLPSDDKRGWLHKAITTVFGQEWSRGNCVDLRVLWLLEVHRRALALERLLASRGVSVARLAPQRAQAWAAKKYVLIDPITLGLPMLLGHLRGSFDVQADATYRLLAVVASIHPLLRYGMDLSLLARAKLPPESLADAGRVLFDWPFAFLPEGMRATVAASPVPSAVANIGRRIEKEADDVQELLRTKRVPRKSPVLRMYCRLLERAPQLLAADTHERALTKHLPPTPSMPDAVYDPDAFLGQLEP
jgi:hypothetical protein